MAILETPSQLLGNRYKLEKQLGAGAMGAVYRVTDRLTRETLALKRVLTSDNNVSIRLALAREFQTLAGLRHPNIISVLDYGFDDDQRPYFVMPLIEGATDLRQVAKQHDDLGKIKLLIQVLQALAYLHRRGIIHRDLKPANVLVTAEGVVKVLDFGLAIEPEKAQEISGTLLYMAPEVLHMEGASPASDLYAVGVMGYEILADLHPFDADTTTQIVHNILIGEPDLIMLEARIDLPRKTAQAISAVIGRLLDKSPQARYSDSYEVIRALSQALEIELPLESEAIRESFLQSARFVGRDQELQKLITALESTLAGKGSQWLIAGESGIGKSRLLDELRNIAIVKGAIVVRGQEIAENGAPYHLWREPIRRIALANPIGDLQASILQDIVHDISTILDRPIPAVPPIDAKDARQRLDIAIAELFANSNKPILLILEDIQWSQESLEPIRILSRVANAPLMIVASYRTDEEVDVAQLFPQMNLIPLRRLENRDIETLTTSMLGMANANPSVIDLLQRETEGNVYFLVETVRALAEEAGSLINVGMTTLPSHVFAGGVQQVVRRRLGHVPAQYHPLLKLSAIVGREIDLRLLATLAPQENLEDWLTTCANVDVFANWDGNWRFSHDKLREVLLSDLDSEERALMNQQVAEAIEATYPNDPKQARKLTDHWRDAKNTQKEAVYALIAGELALGVGSFTEALSLFHRALKGATTPEDFVHIYRNLGDTQESLSQYAEALESYQNSLNIAQEYNDLSGIASAYDGIAGVEEKRGNLDHADTFFNHALSLARDLQDYKLIADTLNGIGTINAKRGDLEQAQAFYTESLAIRRHIKDQRGIAGTLNNLGVIQGFQGNYAQARVFYDEALSIRRDIDDKRGIASTLSNLGVAVKFLEGHTAPRPYYDEAIRIFRTIGDLHGVATLHNNLGSLLLEQREFDEAMQVYQECTRIVREIGDEHGVGYALHNIGRIHLEQRDIEQATAYFQESRDILTRVGDKRALGDVIRDLGIAQTERQALPLAKETLAQALVHFQTVGDKTGVLKTHLAQARWHLVQSDFAGAYPLLQHALNESRSLPSPAMRYQVLMAFAELLMLNNQLSESAEIIGFLGTQNITNADLRHQLARLDANLRDSMPLQTYGESLHQGAQYTLEVLMNTLSQ